VAKRLYAGRYAQAVFEIALERKELDKWQSDLKQIASLGEDAEVMALLEAPKLHFDDKAKLLREKLRSVSPLALNLVYLLVAKNRLDVISELAEEYRRLLNSYRGIEEAEVTTVVLLSDDEKLNLKESIKAIVGKDIVLKTEVDPNLIGGIVVRVGGKLIDGSTRSRLLTLRKELAGVGS
jgi:F-type H+-transporting ATPase subunit delta